jgi:hypothetical protein
VDFGDKIKGFIIAYCSWSKVDGIVGKISDIAYELIPMDKLLIEQTYQTPSVILDPEKNAFEIRGNSMPNNPHAFYTPIMEWLDDYVANSNPETVFTFRLNYQNSSSKKMFHQMLKSLDRIHHSGKKISIDWQYPEDDEELLQSGLEFKKIFTFPVNCVPVSISN